MISKNFQKIQKNITSKAKLIAVTKYVGSAEIQELYNLGQRDFGENRVLDLEKKSQQLLQTCPEIRWHFLGTLQIRKIPKLLEISHLFALHSVSRLKELEKLKELHCTQKLFLQFNTSTESQKQGFETEKELKKAIQYCKDYGLQVQGLMTMATYRTEDTKAEARRCFSKLRELRDLYLEKSELSMGMSSDYLIALEEGSDWVRVGSLLFK